TRGTFRSIGGTKLREIGYNYGSARPLRFLAAPMERANMKTPFSKQWIPFAAALGLGLIGVIRLTIAQSRAGHHPASPASQIAPAPAKAADSGAAADVNLANDQAKLAAKYKDLERVI